MNVEAQPTEKRRLVYTGLREGTKTGEILRTFLDANDPGRTIAYTQSRRSDRNFRSARIGGIYTLAIDSQGSTSFPARLSDVETGTWARDEDIGTWEAHSLATQRARDTGRLKGRETIDRYLDPIRRIRAALNARDQAAFDAYILSKVR